MADLIQYVRHDYETVLQRRSFLKSILLAAVAPAVLLPRLPDHQKWKRMEQGLIVPNPEWVDAPYEILFLTVDQLPPEYTHISQIPKDWIYSRQQPVRLRLPELDPKNIISPFIKI